MQRGTSIVEILFLEAVIFISMLFNPIGCLLKLHFLLIALKRKYLIIHFCAHMLTEAAMESFCMMTERYFIL